MKPETKNFLTEIFENNHESALLWATNVNGISYQVLNSFDWNQFEHVANDLKKICTHGSTKHEFECAFWSTPECHIHSY